MSSQTGWFARLFSHERRQGERRPSPLLVAHYWTGGAPDGQRVLDISSTGFYLLTAQRWFPDTVVKMTLQRTDRYDPRAEDSILVQSRVVRVDENGVGLAFVPAHPRSADRGQKPVDMPADQRSLERFLRGLRKSGHEVPVAARYAIR